jgi:hypothetical protein
MERKLGTVVFTNHALDRCRERGISQDKVVATVRRPDRGRYAATKKAWIYNRTFGQTAVEVVAAQNEYREWVVLSVWSRPVALMNPSRYYVRNRLVDWLLDTIAGWFGRKKRSD